MNVYINHMVFTSISVSQTDFVTEVEMRRGRKQGREDVVGGEKV